MLLRRHSSGTTLPLLLVILVLLQLTLLELARLTLLLLLTANSMLQLLHAKLVLGALVLRLMELNVLHAAPTVLNALMKLVLPALNVLLKLRLQLLVLALLLLKALTVLCLLLTHQLLLIVLVVLLVTTRLLLLEPVHWTLLTMEDYATGLVVILLHPLITNVLLRTLLRIVLHATSQEPSLVELLALDVSTTVLSVLMLLMMDVQSLSTNTTLNTSSVRH